MEKKQKKEITREEIRRVIRQELRQIPSIERYPSDKGEPWEELIDTGKYAPEPPHGGRNPDLLHGLCFRRLYEGIQEIKKLLQK